MPMAPQSDLSRTALLLLFLFSVAVWFGPLDYRKLVKPDEGRYAEIAREMAVTGDWITPRLNGIKYFEKPPLQYWATAAAFKTFGLHGWTARLWTALTGFLTLLLVWWAGRRFFGQAAGNYAALVIGSSFFFLGLGHVNTLDMGLTLFTTLALVGFCAAEQEGVSEPARKRAMLVTWAAMGLAVLSKGLVGIVLPGATLVLYMLLSRDWQLLRRLHLLAGLAIFLAITAPWFVAVSLKNPEFPWFFFIHEHLLRYATSEARREGPVYYFVPILLAGFLPWVVVMLAAMWDVLRNPRALASNRPALVLVIWSIFIFAFFSLSGSKLPSYILPIFPALALLMGRRLAGIETRRLAWETVPIVFIAGAGFYFIADAAINADDSISRPLYHQYSYWLYAATATMLAGALWCCYLAWRGKKLPAVLGLSVAGLLAAQLAVCGHESMAPTQSAHALAARTRPYLGPDTPFYSVKMYDQTLPFYLQRTLTLVDYQDEFSYGLAQEPRLGVPTLAEFKSRWLQDKNALAIMQPQLYEELRVQGLPMNVIVNDGTRIVVNKPGELK